MRCWKNKQRTVDASTIIAEMLPKSEHETVVDCGQQMSFLLKQIFAQRKYMYLETMSVFQDNRTISDVLKYVYLLNGLKC